jgi:hypothetical protein
MERIQKRNRDISTIRRYDVMLDERHVDRFREFAPGVSLSLFLRLAMENLCEEIEKDLKKQNG